MKRHKRLSESSEDYLEAILELGHESPARVRDIAGKLGVSMPSVSAALKKLRAKGLVKDGRYDYIELTDEGKSLASRVVKKHRLLVGFLHETLGLDMKLAEEEACKLEHVLSNATMLRMAEFQKFFGSFSNIFESWKKQQKNNEKK